MQIDKERWDARHADSYMPKIPCEFMQDITPTLKEQIARADISKKSNDIYDHTLSRPEDESKSNWAHHERDIDPGYDYPPLNGLRALDIASGSGRHSKYLRSLGYEVVALDISSVGLAELDGIEGITPICVDLDDFCDIEASLGKFDLIVNLYFLDRYILTRINSLLNGRGLFAFSGFVYDEAVDEGPSPHMLMVNELEDIFAEERLVFKAERPVYCSNSRFNRLIELVVQKI